MIFKAKHDPDNMLIDETKIYLYAIELANETYANRKKNQKDE